MGCCFDNLQNVMDQVTSYSLLSYGAWRMRSCNRCMRYCWEYLGKKSTYESVLQGFCWFGVLEDFNMWVQKCEICAAGKRSLQNLKAMLGEIPVGHLWVGWPQMSLVHCL